MVQIYIDGGEEIQSRPRKAWNKSGRRALDMKIVPDHNKCVVNDSQDLQMILCKWWVRPRIFSLPKFEIFTSLTNFQ